MVEGIARRVKTSIGLALFFTWLQSCPEGQQIDPHFQVRKYNIFYVMEN